MLKYILKRKYGLIVNLKKIIRHIKINNIKTRLRKKKHHYNEQIIDYQTTTNLYAKEKIANNITLPNKVWSIDVTYLINKNFKFYLIAVKDVVCKSIISYSFSEKANTEIILETIKKAHKNSNSPNNVIIHSDQGAQFTAEKYFEFCKSLNIRVSMSQPGCPTQNANIESFFGTMKHELNLYQLINKLTKFELINLISTYISHYNFERLHSSIKYLTPSEFYSKFKYN